MYNSGIFVHIHLITIKTVRLIN